MQANRVGKLINFCTQSSIYWYIKKLVYCIQYILVYQGTSVLYPVYTGISRNQCTVSSIYWLYQGTSVLYTVYTGYIKELVYCIQYILVYQGTSVLYPVYTGISRNQCTVFSIYWYIKKLVYYIQYILVYQGASVLYPVDTCYIKKLVYFIQYILVYQGTSVLYPVYTGISRNQFTVSSINWYIKVLVYCIQQTGYIKKLVFCIQYIQVYQETSELYLVYTGIKNLMYCKYCIHW